MSGMMTRASRFGPPRVMSEEEVRAFLAEGWWGTMATSAGGVPYGVPVVYGFDGASFWVVAREGRKVRNLRRNPRVCLSVVRVPEDGAWTSVVVTGTAELVEGLESRIAAVSALRRQCGRRRPVNPRDVSRMASARVIRIDPEEITGRALSAPEGGVG